LDSVATTFLPDSSYLRIVNIPNQTTVVVASVLQLRFWNAS